MKKNNPIFTVRIYWIRSNRDINNVIFQIIPNNYQIISNILLGK